MLKARLKSNRIEAGCDEVGRGCLAGPVVAASVILPPRFKHQFLKDSKQLSSKTRYEIEKIIKQKAISWSIAEVSPKKIDEINILNASFLAMELAIEQLKIQPHFLLIDGNRFKTNLSLPYQCIVKGDSKVGSIAAASILAKNYRDKLMHQYHLQQPQYGWDKNVGYPTKQHREALRKYGVANIHRMSFRLLPEQLSLDL